MREEGYYLKIVKELRTKDDKTQNYEFIYNIISSEEAKLDAMNIVYNIGYIKGKSITEYDRIIEKSWINEWKTVPKAEFYLVKLSMEEVKKIKIKQIIKSIEYNLKELKKYNEV